MSITVEDLQTAVAAAFTALNGALDNAKAIGEATYGPSFTDEHSAIITELQDTLTAQAAAITALGAE